MAELREYQPSFTAGVLAPSLWARVDLAKYASGLKTATNVFIHPHGGVSNRAGLQFIGEVKDSTKNVRLIPFVFNADQAYVLEFGDLYMRVWRDGGQVDGGGGTPYEITTPYAHGDVGDLVFAQEADVMYITHVDYPVQKLSRFADDNWKIADVTFGPAISAPASAPTVTKPGDTSGETGYVATTYNYKISYIDEDTGEESLPSAAGSVTNDLSIAGGINRVSWTAQSGVSRYIVYKEDNGVYGYIGGTEGTSFDDENITADVSDTPQRASDLFDATDDYPRCVSFVEQRLAFGSSNNDPQAIWMSQSASYENFGNSIPPKASDAVTFRIKARQVNEIRSLMPMRGMMALSSSAEWIVSGGSNSDAITPSAIKIDNHGYRGSSTVQPIAVGNVVLLAQARGGIIRDFSYEFTSKSYTGKDLTVLARHLFRGKEIVKWAYAQAPHSIIWVVLDDGSLVSLTYMKEHDVWGWTEHESASGVFEDVITIPEGGEDVPYFIVKRTIDGSDVRYIEALHTREFSTVEDAFFVDSGLTYSGAAATSISGLDHLEGETVVALADGNVVRGLTVSSGSVTLPNAAEKAHIGLPVEASIQTLDLDLGQVQGIGTVQGRQKTVSEVTLRVEDTRGIFIGPDDGARDDENVLVEYKQRSTEAWNEAISLYTGDLSITPHWDWSTNGDVWVKQFDPLPMTILAIMPDVVIGR